MGEENRPTSFLTIDRNSDKHRENVLKIRNHEYGVRFDLQDGLVCSIGALCLLEINVMYLGKHL